VLFFNSLVYDYSKDELVNWIRYEAGSKDKSYFSSLKQGGLFLQQIPEEYAELLLYFKASTHRRYLELGVGAGGSFLLNCLFQKKTLQSAIAVDDLSYATSDGVSPKYREFEISEKVTAINNWGIQAQFANYDTDAFFSTFQFERKFDCIFIDAGHDYSNVKKDYDNSLLHLETGGNIILHDINSVNCPGVVQLWKEVQNDKCQQFIFGNNCGIGIWTSDA
jgi:hypothetical protein